MPVAQEVEAAGPLGRAFCGFGVDFWLRLAFTARQVSVLAEFLCFGPVLILFCLAFRARGGVSEVYRWVVFDYAEAT